MSPDRTSRALTVRVPQALDLRRFPDLPRGTTHCERLHQGRTAVERGNGRLKLFWGSEDGQVYGSRRFHAHAGAVRVVQLAFAPLLAQTPRSEAGAYGQRKLTPGAAALPERVRGAAPLPASAPA